MTPLWNTIAATAHLTLTDAQLGQLDRYLDLLIEKNKVLNLTRITDRPAAELLHVADALTLLRHLPPVGTPRRHVADVGTGGGIPGVVLAVARPDLDVLLIDATRKKLDAVLEMASAVGVKNVRTHHGRVETVEQHFNVITARGVANLDTLVGWCAGLLKPSSVLLAMKGPKAGEEIDAAARTLKRARLRADIRPVDVPGLEGHCVVVLTRA